MGDNFSEFQNFISILKAKTSFCRIWIDRVLILYSQVSSLQVSQVVRSIFTFEFFYANICISGIILTLKSSKAKIVNRYFFYQ